VAVFFISKDFASIKSPLRSIRKARTLELSQVVKEALNKLLASKIPVHSRFCNDARPKVLASDSKLHQYLLLCLCLLTRTQNVVSSKEDP
jgi:hypothetical protein